MLTLKFDTETWREAGNFNDHPDADTLAVELRSDVTSRLMAEDIEFSWSHGPQRVGVGVIVQGGATMGELRIFYEAFDESLAAIKASIEDDE